MRGTATSPGPASLLYFRGIPEAAASRGRVVELPPNLPARFAGSTPPLPELQPSCLLPDDQCLEDSGLRGDQGPALHAGESPAAPGPLEAQPHVSDPHLILRGLAVTSTFSCLQGVGGPRLVCAFENHTQVTACREPSAASPPQVAQGETAGPPLSCLCSCGCSSSWC